MLLSAPLISSNNSAALVWAAAVVTWDDLWSLEFWIKRPLLELQVMWYTSFVPIPSLTSPPPPSRCPSSPSSATSFFNLSSPISSPSLSRLSHSVSLYCSIAPSLPFSPALAILTSYYFWTNVERSLNSASAPLTSFCDLIPRLLLSISPPLYLPRRLIITSSTVELIAQFRKGRKKKEEPCSPFIRSGNQTLHRRQTSLFLAYVQYTCR